jgi:hypothetical protein
MLRNGEMIKETHQFFAGLACYLLPPILACALSPVLGREHYRPTVAHWPDHPRLDSEHSLGSQTKGVAREFGGPGHSRSALGSHDRNACCPYVCLADTLGCGSVGPRKS